MRTLLAEDDFASRKFMDKFLSQYGDCDVTVDGGEVVDAFLMAIEEGEPYDLLCLDIMMPVCDGYQVMKAIRNIEKDRGVPEEGKIKIVAMTALGDEADRKRAYDSGCSGFVTKPVDVEKLEKTLKELSLIQG